MRPLFPSLRGLPKTYWTLLGGALLNRLGGFVFTFLAIYLTEVRHFSVATTGTIVGLCGLGSFASGPVGGWLADRIGRRPAMLAGLVLGPCALALLGLATTAHEIGAAAFLYGFFGDLYRPVNQAMIADVIAPADRARAFGLLHWAVNLGFAFATVLGGVMAHRNFAALFVADGATTLAFALLVYLRVPETRAPVRDVSRTAKAALHDLIAPLLDPVMVAFMSLSFATGMIFLQCNVTLPIDMRVHGLSTDAFGALLALNGVLIVLLSPLSIAFVPRLPRGRALAASALLVGVGFGANALAGSVPLYALAIATWTFGEILQAAVMPAVVADLAPANRRGIYQGFFVMSWGGASFAAPLAGSFVYERSGATTLWLGCLAVGAICALGHLALARSRGHVAAVEPHDVVAVTRG